MPAMVTMRSVATEVIQEVHLVCLVQRTQTLPNSRASGHWSDLPIILFLFSLLDVLKKFNYKYTVQVCCFQFIFYINLRNANYILQGTAIQL